MAADLGGSQISALLESVPGIRNVLRSPVADALVNTIRSAVGLRPFAFADAEELVQYAVRRGLINQSEGDQVIEDVRATGIGRQKTTGPAKRLARKAPPRKPTPPRKPVVRQGKASEAAKTKGKAPARRPVKKR